MKLENLYSDKESLVTRKDFELLYEEHLELQNRYDKLTERFCKISKLSDKQFGNVLEKNDKYVRDAKRFSVILKHSDKQGAKLLNEKGLLEAELEAELLQEQKLLMEIETTQKEIVFTLGTVGESRSRETGNHVRRVSEYSKLLALYSGVDEEDAEKLRIASPMHDIGKVATPDYILNKPAKLTSSEFEIMKGHSTCGYNILKYSSRPLLKVAAIVAYEHHEKWDGSGYPKGLKGDKIHLFGRITALADVFDALGSDRVYKKAWRDEDIFQYFRDEKAKHFDPELVDIFFKHLDEFLAIRAKFQDIIKHEK